VVGSGIVDGKLRHWSGQKAMGSGGASCAARSEEKRGAGKRKSAMAALGAFGSTAVAWSSGGIWYGWGGCPVEGQGEGSGRPATAGRGGCGHQVGSARAGEGAVREGGGGMWATVALGC
jgi:hypothetical protein